jgi:hypothetical protein
VTDLYDETAYRLVAPMRPATLHGALSPRIRLAVHALAWSIAFAALCNALFFVLRVTSPVMQSDAWYFLDVFLRKAIDGHLSIADFFVKRPQADHAQPLFKLVLLLEWRYFNLDFMVEAVVGAIAAAGCALIFYRMVFAGSQSHRREIVPSLAWATICALLFSMNAEAMVWTWSLITLEYLNLLYVLLFMMAAWHAIQKRNYLLLALTSVLVGIGCDDLGLLALLAVSLALLLGRFRDPALRQLPVSKILVMVGVCTIAVRIGYAYAPIVGPGRPESALAHVDMLPIRLLDGGWWKWIVWPLVFPVFNEGTMSAGQAELWAMAWPVIAVLLMSAHLWFWHRAVRSKFNLPVFVAVCLMIFGYAQIAGIVLGRVAVDGNDYLQQPRYMVRYAQLLIALLLMWACSSESSSPRSGRRRCATAVAAAGCLALLAMQIPLSVHAWWMAPYNRAYQVHMANQIDELARHPSSNIACLPELPVCTWPTERRQELTHLLSDNRLNVFSPQVQKRHDYLPVF